jgi:uncharacterized membrane protein HdeD (DUF308 family)
MGAGTYNSAGMMGKLTLRFMPLISPGVDWMKDQGMEDRLVTKAIWVGLFLTIGGLLVLVGVLGTHSQTAVVTACFVICVGLALVLAAFGTRAEAKWRNWTAAGAGVVALILFPELMYYLKPSWTKTGSIEVDFSDFQKVAILSTITHFMNIVISRQTRFNS